MSRQLALSLDGSVDGQGDRTVPIRFEPVHVSRSTFKSGLSQRVHRWFRLTPSYGAELVQLMLEDMSCSSSDVVLDPFSGAATTQIECGLNGIRARGFEINPFLKFVGETSTYWALEPDKLKHQFGILMDRFQSSKRVSTAMELPSIGLHVPPIHNPSRWWRDDVLIDLLRLKREIQTVEDDRARSFFSLALAGVLVPDLTNVTLGRLQLHFIDKSDVEMSVTDSFMRHCANMIRDIEELASLDRQPDVKIWHQNALDLSDFNEEVKADVVITSPPYPNRYSYVWNTRPYLYLFDFITTGHEASQLDKKTIGGTWGTATSELSKGLFEPRSKTVAQALMPFLVELRKADTLMANYVVHYFNRLEAQIEEMRKVTTGSTKMAYVVGNSEIKGHYIETDYILAQIFSGLGYNVKEIHRFRRRNSGKDLFESIVYASQVN